MGAPATENNVAYSFRTSFAIAKGGPIAKDLKITSFDYEAETPEKVLEKVLTNAAIAVIHNQYNDVNPDKLKELLAKFNVTL